MILKALVILEILNNDIPTHLFCVVSVAFGMGVAPPSRFPHVDLHEKGDHGGKSMY